MIPSLPPEHTLTLCEKHAPYLSKLRALYSEMDEQYEQAASRYGFICRGCDDNCCRTRFYHYTHLEYLYIMEGFYQLPAEMRRNITLNAREVHRQMEAEDKLFGLMCPLNMEDKCILYPHRPMICRLHGIPHELRKPGSPAQYHQGCIAFHNRHGDKPYFEFDRTPLYIELSRLEREFKTTTKMASKVKLTVAEMLLIEI